MVRRRSRAQQSDTFTALHDRYGVTMTLAEVCEIFGIKVKTAHNRLYEKKWPIATSKLHGRIVMSTVEVAAYIDKRKSES